MKKHKVTVQTLDLRQGEGKNESGQRSRTNKEHHVFDAIELAGEKLWLVWDTGDAMLFTNVPQVGRPVTVTEKGFIKKNTINSRPGLAPLEDVKGTLTRLPGGKLFLLITRLPFVDKQDQPQRIRGFVDGTLIPA